jgi:hypothetical protein
LKEKAMGDISRDTFKLTNVLHQILTGENVSNGRHYIGVRLQQGVPVLDADWNDCDDIRRRELELVIRDIIGDGVPGLQQGFAIGQVEADNDFIINPGVLVLGGWEVINPVLKRYSELFKFYDIDNNYLGTDLNTPSGDRIDIVYLDVNEQETTYNSDPRIVNEQIGLETAIRLERVWNVCVAEGASDFSSLILDEPGHKYYPLAKLYRSSSARIEAHMIEDLRRLGLTLADGIKAPMYLQRGTEVVDPSRFSIMLLTLRGNLKIWQQNGLFPVSIVSLEAWMAYLNALNEVYHLTTSAEVSSDTRNLDNNDGLKVIGKLADAQEDMLDTFRTFGTGVPEEMAVLDLYQAYIEGDPSKNIGGIRPSLSNNDLLGAVQGQNALNDFLSLGTGELPQGSVAAILQNVDPGTAVTTGGMTLTYEVTSHLTVPATPEVFDLNVTVSDVRWAVTLGQTQVTLAPGESVSVEVTVDPADTLTNGDFADINLVARSHWRPSIKSQQTAQRFTIGELPPGETFFYYSGVPLTDGTLHIPRAQIEEQFCEVYFTLVNSTGGESAGGQRQGFDVVYELVFPPSPPSGVDPSTWIPPTPNTLADQIVIGASAETILSIRAPSLAPVSEDVLLTLRATSTLTSIGGAPVSGGKSATIDLPVRVLIA